VKSLGYLIGRRLRNTLISWVKNPGRLILLVVVAAFLVFSIVTRSLGREEYRDISELYSVAFLYFLFMEVMVIINGFSSGAAFFTMPDVNILFNAPYKPWQLLLYGLLRQLGTALFMGLMLVMQYSWMNGTYGVGFGFILILVLGYALVLFGSSLIAMLIYANVAGDNRRKNIVQGVFYTLLALLGAYVVLPVIGTGSGFFTAASARLNTFVINLIPGAGWNRAIMQGLVEGSVPLLLLGAGLFVLLLAVTLIFFTRLDADFYEDVLASAEIAWKAKAQQQEGQMPDLNPSRKVRVGKEGIGRGSGAGALYYKHRLESRRGGGRMLNALSVIFLAATLIFQYIFREEGYPPGLFMAVYMNFFSSFMGLWNRELLKPYIYLIPDKPFRKLIFTVAQTMEKNLLQAVIVTAGIGWITQPGPAVLALVFLVLFSSSMLFMASTVLEERLFGGIPARWLQTIFFFLCIVILAAPGLVVSIILGIVFHENLGLLTMGLYMAGVSLLVGFLCRGIMEQAEIHSA